jgi:hypothetical protein
MLLESEKVSIDFLKNLVHNLKRDSPCRKYVSSFIAKEFAASNAYVTNSLGFTPASINVKILFF